MRAISPSLSSGAKLITTFQSTRASDSPDSTPQQRRSKRLPHLLINQTVQSPRTPTGFISLLGKPIPRALLDEEFDPPIRGSESLLHLAKAEGDNLGEVGGRE